ncbi:ABC transporter substrate-binding protein [Glaciecola sp. MH2013]|uniref:helical backbone metal receptor n=1 Tax=Glaciecola sp. MH2013 TaxID=2785524 RepID=UPI00189F622C|nr:helical backbone metal receptor [Glaciecola sp. MH2013]MBF7074934.1 ABC transporter substrate-binding protein [Glaciecola sp. MH2013]
MLINAFCFVLISLFSTASVAADDTTLFEPNKSSQTEELRVVSLSPHLSEIVFALNRQTNLVAVSDYSDYPFGQGCLNQACSIKAPSVASYQGADIAQIVRLQPTHILAWDGGNKAQDLARLEQLGFTVYRSAPKNVSDLLEEIEDIALLLHAKSEGATLLKSLRTQFSRIKESHIGKHKSAVYYMNSQPLSGVANDPWLNSLLASCGISNVYQDLTAGFVQFSLADIIRKQPELIIAALNDNKANIETFWNMHESVLSPKLLQVNPDALHRFTPRVLPALEKLCEQAYL